MQHLRREGLEVPGRRDLAEGLRPGARQDEERTVGLAPGWQHEATEAVLTHLLESSVRPRLIPAEQALLRSQGGPMSRVPFTSFPTSPISRFDSSVFRVLLLRRLWLPLPPSTQVLVRPSSRRSCPSPCCLRCGWSVGAARASLGVSSCTCVPRGRGASVHQCPGAGPRHSAVGPSGWAEVGRGSIGDGHHHCVAFEGSHARDGVALRTARRAKTRTCPELTRTGTTREAWTAA